MSYLVRIALQEENAEKSACRSGFTGADLLALMKAGRNQESDTMGIANNLRQAGMRTNPFFVVEIEDDTLTVGRLTPGSTAQPVAEVTTIDRSPAGLVQSVTCNGDLLLSCAFDTCPGGGYSSDLATMVQRPSRSRKQPHTSRRVGN